MSCRVFQFIMTVILKIRYVNNQHDMSCTFSALHLHQASHAKKMVMCLTIDSMFCYGQVRVRDLPEEEQAAADLLTISGYLAIEPSDSVADQGASVVTFISRLHMEYMRVWFYHHSRDEIGLVAMPAVMFDFLRLVLQRMSSTRMASCSNSSGSPSRGLVEAPYQNDFYRSGCNLAASLI